MYMDPLEYNIIKFAEHNFEYNRLNFGALLKSIDNRSVK